MLQQHSQSQFERISLKFSCGKTLTFPQRSEFPSCFDFSSIANFFFIRKQECDLRGQKCFDFKAPDSITSYILSGISMNAKHGLGLPDVKPKLTVFLPFFIDAALPNNMKRGEVLMQDILLFNYLITQNVVITIKRNDKQYEFLDPKLDGWTGE